MKFCYIDESGLGSEPYLVMVGVIVDAQRMHKTKEMWDEFLEMLSKVCKKKINEFHTCDFYAGNGIWRGINGPQRAEIISAIINWWGRRKHHLTFTVIEKSSYEELRCNNKILGGCESLWQTAAIHISLSIQKAHKGIGSNKGHTLLLFDRENMEEEKFSNFISNPPGWIDEYYDREAKQKPLDQIIDVPFFADSKQVLLLQVADVIAFIIRRYTEITTGKSKVNYHDEQEKLEKWVRLILSRCYATATRWPAKGLNNVQLMFNSLAPLTIRQL